MARRRKPVRHFYPHKKGPDPVRPIATADPLVDHHGVHLDFHVPAYSYTPDELENLARWLYSLAHEANALAEEGLIDEEAGYDVNLRTRAKRHHGTVTQVVPPPADV